MTRRKSKRGANNRLRTLLTLLALTGTICFMCGVVSTYLCMVDSKEPVQEDYQEPVITLTPEKEQVSKEPYYYDNYYTYTDDELDLLARLIFSEGGTESFDTKLKIGSVVMNRVSAPNFPNTIEEVIYQKNQFAVTTTKIDGVIMIDRPADEDSVRAAKEILDYGSVLPSDVQVFYAQGKCDGNWVTTREVYEVSDNTVFAYIYEKGDGA